MAVAVAVAEAVMAAAGAEAVKVAIVVAMYAHYTVYILNWSFTSHSRTKQSRPPDANLMYRG